MRENKCAGGEILPGLKPVLELLKQRPDRVARVYCRGEARMAAEVDKLCRANNIPLETVDLSFLDALCGSRGRRVAHQGIAALVRPRPLPGLAQLLDMAPAAPLPLVIALDQVKDPGNLGAIARTAHALGCAGLLLPAHNSASIGPGAHKASAGALDKLAISIVANLGHALDEAEERDFRIYGAASSPAGERGRNAFGLDWRLPAVLALGGEERGLRDSIAKRCSQLVTIPLARQFDSLNVAQACAILLGLCAARFNRS